MIGGVAGLRGVHSFNAQIAAPAFLGHNHRLSKKAQVWSKKLQLTELLYERDARNGCGGSKPRLLRGSSCSILREERSYHARRPRADLLGRSHARSQGLYTLQ